MERFKDSKVVKIIAGILAFAFLLSVVVVFAGSGNAASKQSSIAFVDTQAIFKEHPATAEARTKLAEEAKKAEEDFNKKKATLDQAAQEKMVTEYRQQLAEKEQTLVKGVMEKIDVVVGEVAKAKGVSVVLDKNNVFYGGTDLTADVLAKIKK